MFALCNFTQTVEVHRVDTVLKFKRILYHASVVTFDDETERMVDRGLYYNTVSGLCEKIDIETQSFDDARNKSEFLAVYFEIVASLEPPDYRVPVAVGRLVVAVDRVFGSFLQSLGNLGADSEVEVGYPHGHNVVTAENAVESVDFDSPGDRTVDN